MTTTVGELLSISWGEEVEKQKKKKKKKTLTQELPITHSFPDWSNYGA